MSNLGSERSTTAKADKSPSLRDLEWATGFLEGEGSFQHNHVPKNSSQSVKAVQKIREPLEKLKDMFGGRILPSQGVKAKDLLYWATYGSRARGIMMTLYPLMSKKRQQQIRVALKGGN